MSATPAVPEPASSQPAPVPLDALLAPIPGPDPAGEWLRYEGTYDAIQAARREDDPSLPQGVWETDLRRADWGAVARLCEAALSQRSKDLQIAIWLVEARVHLQGLAGLAAGLGLVNRLCDGYWEVMHPKLQPDEPEYRSAPLDWMAKQLALLVRLLPLTPDVEAVGHPLTLEDWERLAPAASAGAEPGLNRDRFLQATMAHGAGFYRTLLAQCAEAGAVLARLAAATDQRFRPQDAPSLAPLRDALDALQAQITRILEDRGELSVEEGAVGEAPAQPAPAAVGASTGRLPPIASREEAYRRIREGAYYLLRTEPHSPVPYLALRAVTWGSLNLSELLEELVPDVNSIAYIRAFLALDPPPHGSLLGERDDGAGG
jgi:type VI secretion system protein ImpA